MPKTNIKSKKHVAHLEQVRRQTQTVKIVSIGVIVVVLGLVLYGLVIEPMIQPFRPVANVNGETITIGKFQLQAKMQRLQLVNQYNQYMQYAQLFGVTDLTNDQNFGPAIRQIQEQLVPTTLGRAALDAVVNDQLIRQEAKKRNITVSPEEIEEELQIGFGYYANGSPTPTETIAPTVESTLNATQLAVITITPTPGTITPSPTPTLDPSITPTITFTPTTTLTPTATATAGPSPTITPTITPLPTSTPVSLEGYQEMLKQNLDAVNSAAHLSESDYRSYYESIVYRKKLQEVITADLKPLQEQVWARHILVSTQEEAQQVLDRLQKGEDFGAIAAEMSTDTGSSFNGGDLGWFGKGRMVTEFQDAAFALKVGEISQPVQTNFGYHIIQVLGHEDRPVSGDDFQQYKDQTFQDFLQDLRDNSSIEEYDIWMESVPTEPELTLPQTQ